MAHGYSQLSASSAAPFRNITGAPALQQPIDDAVSTAFDKSDIQGLDPNLIAQITENVIKQLKQANLQPTPSSNAKPNGSSVEEPPIPLSSSQAEKHTQFGTGESPEPASTVSASDDARSPSRPKGPQRLSMSLEETPLERFWGVLFDERGLPTDRLDQLLRGLAVHLIEDYEPKHSLVVTPAKVVRYYRETKLGDESYPWHIIFDDEETYISRMYRDLGCEHHLIQDNVYERPEVPGLTPVGFSKWMTFMLLAHPDQEFERLRSSVINMPISNPNDRKERFPKDLSRRLFPASADAKARTSLRRAIRKHSKARIDPPETDEQFPSANLTDSNSSVPLPTTNQRDSQSDNGDMIPLPFERERQPYRASTGQAPPFVLSKVAIPTVGPAGENAIADDDYAIPSRPIERERKPYFATPGRGRDYEQATAASNTVKNTTYAPIAGSVNVTASYPPPPPPRQSSTGPPSGLSGLTRSNSNRGAGRAPVGGSSNINGMERGPPPAPSAGTAGGASLPPEIHQQPSARDRSRNASFTRRRAPSTGRPNPGTDLDGRSSHVTFEPGSHDSRRPVYVERTGGHNGYGPYEDDFSKRARGWSSSQFSDKAPAIINGGSLAPDEFKPTGRNNSFERRRDSPTKRDRSVRYGSGAE